MSVTAPQHGENDLQVATQVALSGEFMDQENSPRSDGDNWRVPARHGGAPHRRWPSTATATRTVRGAGLPVRTAPWAPTPDALTGQPSAKAAPVKGAVPAEGAKAAKPAAAKAGAQRAVVPAPEQAKTTTGALPIPITGNAVKMGRREAWARFLAYEVRPLTTVSDLHTWISNGARA